MNFMGIRLCAAAAALFIALPAAANDKDHDRRGHGYGHDEDELAADIQALKERVRKLEGHLTRDEVVGSYVFRSLQTALITNTNQPTVGRLEHLAAEGGVELNANGTFTLNLRESGFNAIWQVPTLRNRVDKLDTGSGTWTYQNGVISMTFDGGEVVPFAGAVGGRLFLRAESNPADGTTTIVLLVKKNQ